MSQTVFKTKEHIKRCECYVCTGKVKTLKGSDFRPSKKDRARRMRKERKKRPKSYDAYVNKRHPRWLATRDRAIKRYGKTCMVCGSDKNIHVHHATYERLYNERTEDLRILCSSCHDHLHDLHKRAGKPDLYDFTDGFIDFFYSKSLSPYVFDKGKILR